MKLTVSDGVAQRFPNLRIAVLVARHIDNEGVDFKLDALKKMAARALYHEWTSERLAELPEIKVWRNAYRSFGVKPKTSRPTAEAFLRRLIKGEPFPTISKVVDSYLLAETKFYLPVGGYDLDTISGDIILRFSRGAEPFTPIGSDDSEVTQPGEVVYADATRILTRKWNFRDCDTSKVTESSTNVALFTEAPFSSIVTSRLTQSIDSIACSIREYCGGTTTRMLLDCSVQREVWLS